MCVPQRRNYATFQISELSSLDPIVDSILGEPDPRRDGLQALLLGAHVRGGADRHHREPPPRGVRGGAVQDQSDEVPNRILAVWRAILLLPLQLARVRDYILYIIHTYM